MGDNLIKIVGAFKKNKTTKITLSTDCRRSSLHVWMDVNFVCSSGHVQEEHQLDNE